MAKCEICGKKPMSGHNVSFSMKHTKRLFRPNIQKTTVLEGSRMVRKNVCTRCLKTMSKSSKMTVA
jgi:large subunit ribosomal protein L28